MRSYFSLLILGEALTSLPTYETYNLCLQPWWNSHKHSNLHGTLLCPRISYKVAKQVRNLLPAKENMKFIV